MRVVSGPRPGLKHTIVHKSHGRLVSKGPNMEAGMDISAVIIHTPCNHSSSTPPITRPTLLTCIPPYLLHADLCAGQHPAQHVGDVFMRHARPVVLQIETEKPV